MSKFRYDLAGAMEEFGEAFDVPSDIEVVKEAPAPVAEPAEQPKPVDPPVADSVDPVKEEAEKPDFIKREDLGALESQINVMQRQVNERLSQVAAAIPRQPEPQQAPTQYEHQYDEDEQESNALRDLENLKAEVKSLQARAGNEYAARENFARAVKAVSTQFDDLDSFIPPERRDYALQAALANNMFDINWQDELEKTYSKLAINHYRNEVQAARQASAQAAKERDELAAKREEKRVQAANAAAQIPSAVPGYQPPAKPTLQPYQRGYKDSKAAFSAELEAFGG